jgi:two-component system LytT family response regulator
MIRALLVDDEALAREGIRFEIERETDLSVVAEAIDGPDAVDAISRFRPDLVFLDIEIPVFDGFEVLRRVSPALLPIVVFVTAYDRYAVRAFDAHAIDYLMKPIRSQRFHEAVERSRIALSNSETRSRFHHRLMEIIESRERLPLPDRTSYYRRFTVRDGNKFVVIKATDVDWFESASNYVALHVRGREHLLRITLSDLEKQLDPVRLDPVRFVRIHRSTIVNLERVGGIRPTFNGDYLVVLTDGRTLRLSRVFRDRVMRSTSIYHSSRTNKGFRAYPEWHRDRDDAARRWQSTVFDLLLIAVKVAKPRFRI